jgi:hypothetical protein
MKWKRKWRNDDQGAAHRLHQCVSRSPKIGPERFLVAMRQVSHNKVYQVEACFFRRGFLISQFYWVIHRSSGKTQRYLMYNLRDIQIEL